MTDQHLEEEKPLRDQYKAPDWLASAIDENGFYDVRRYMAWTMGQEYATLDGGFTAQELRDLADFMDAHS